MIRIETRFKLMIRPAGLAKKSNNQEHFFKFFII